MERVQGSSFSSLILRFPNTLGVLILRFPNTLGVLILC